MLLAGLLILLVLGPVSSGSALAAIAYVQQNGSVSNNSAFPVTSVNIAVSSPPAVGNTVIVTFSADSSTGAGSLTCSDDQGNSYNTDVQHVFTSVPPNYPYVAICSAKIGAGQVPTAITLTHHNAYNRLAFVHEYSGLAASPSLDQASSGGGNNSTPSSGATPVTTQADELVIGAVSVADGNNAVINTDGNFPGGPFKLSQGAGSYPRSLSTQYRIVSATASYTFAPTLTAGRLWAAGIATYKAATASSCTVTNTNDAGAGSLRDCITYANSNPGTTISFNIPGPGNQSSGPDSWWRISPTGTLPTITANGTMIDGTTQTTNQGDTNSLGPEIEINGGSAGAVDGLTMTSANNTIKGLIVNGYSQVGRDGILITGASATNNTISGNYVGTNYAGTAAVANYYGIVVNTAASSNTIGGTTLAERNIISGNTFDGVAFFGASVSGNTVEGNYIGTDRDGTAVLANGYGVTFANGPTGNTVGGTTAAERNIISGSTIEGLRLWDTATTGNTIIGNYIGTDVNGTTAIPNTVGIGIWNGSNGNTIGGEVAGDRNIISGNSTTGILISGSGTNSNVVKGNHIGTKADGLSALANGGDGVRIDSGAQFNTIGGDSAAKRNLISGNTLNGVFIVDLNTSNNTVSGNYIGTDINGTSPIPNVTGVLVSTDSTFNTVGGTTAGERNIISGNSDTGVRLTSSGNSNNTVIGNYIGTDLNGTSALPNVYGVRLNAGAQSNTIGGTGSGEGNVIAFNSNIGVYVHDAATDANIISANSIFSNTNLGIDLEPAGVGTGSDANNDQPAPTITGIVVNGSDFDATVTLTVNDMVEFFRVNNPAAPVVTADASGDGEGFLYLGSCSDDGGACTGPHISGSDSTAGDGTITVTLLSTGLSGGDDVTATTTDATNGTSEFATNVAAPVAGITVSGSCKQQDEASNCADGRTIRVAVNGSLQAQSTTTLTGAWTISGVTTPSSGDVITIYIEGVADANEAVAVTKYDGTGNITGIDLFEEHLTIGSDDNQTLTHADLSQYDYSASGNNEDLFFEVDGANDLSVDNLANMTNEELYIKTGNTYRPDSASSGNVTTHHIKILGAMTADGNTITVSGDFDASSGTFNYDTSTVDLTGTGNLNVQNVAYTEIDFYDLNMAAASNTTTLLSNVGVGNVLTLGTGTVAGATRELGLLKNSGAPLIDAGAAINISALFYRPVDGTINVAGGTGYTSEIWLWPTGSNATFNIAGAITTTRKFHIDVDTGNSGVIVNTQNNALTIYGLDFGLGVIDGSSTFNAGSSTIDIDESGLRVGGGTHTVNLGSAIITNAGDWETVNGARSLTIDPGTSSVTFDGLFQSYIESNGNAFNNLEINKTSSSDPADDITLIDALDVNGTLTITDGEFDIVLNDPLITTAGSVTIAAAGSVTTAGRTANWTFDGTTAATYTDATAGPQNIGVVLINKTDTVSPGTNNKLTLASSMTADTVTIDGTAGQGDTLDLNGNNLTVTNTLTVEAEGVLQLEGGETLVATTTTLNAGSTVLYDGAGGYTHLEVGDSYSNLTFNGSGSWTLDAPLDVNANFTLTTGTVDANGHNINGAGDWSNTGTFTHGSATVTLDGTAQTVNGNTTFYNFNKTVAAAETLTFQAASTTTIAAGGTATLNGASGQLLSLRSDTPGTRWNFSLNAGAIKAIDFVDVQDSDASASDSGLIPILPTNSTDSGNTLEWFTYITIDTDFSDWCDGSGTEFCVDDEGGADDWTNPAVLDITRFGVASNRADTFYLLFGFDDTNLGFASTACILVDTDDPANDTVDKAFCVVIDGSPTSVVSVEMYDCDDSIIGGCGGASLTKTYTPTDYGFSNSTAGPWNTDSFLELEVPYTDLGVVNGAITFNTLISYPGKTFLKAPKDSIFGNPDQDYEKRIQYDSDDGTGTPIAGPGNQSVSGIVYSDEGATEIGVGRTVRLIKNGVSVGTDTTDANGGYFISGVINDNDNILVYVDGDDGATDDGTTVTVFSGPDLLNLDIYVDHLIIRHDNASVITHALMKTALEPYSDTEILYSVDGSNNLTVSGANTELYIAGGHSYTPGGNVGTVHAKNEGTWTATGTEAYTLSGNWTNNGSFTAASSTVNLTGTGQAINGSTTFYNLTKSVAAADTLTFQAGQTTTIATGGTVTLNGASGQLLSLRSDSTPTQWNITLSTGATKAISFVDVQDSDASGSDASLKPINPANSLSSGNNIDWFPGATISGTVYTDEGVTTIADGTTVRLIVDGLDVGTDTTSGGAYTITSADISAGVTLLVYIDNDATYKGTTVTVSDGNNLSGLDLYAAHLITRQDNGGGLTPADLNTAIGGLGDTDILYTPGGTVVVNSDIELFVPSGHTLILDSGIDTQGAAGHLDLRGTLTFVGSSGLSISGDVSIPASGRLSSSGVATGLFVIGGSWSDALGTTNIIGPDLDINYEFIGVSKTLSTDESFFAVRLVAPASITMTDDVIVADQLRIDSGATLTQGANTLIMSGTVFNINGGYNHTCASIVELNGTISLETSPVSYPNVVINNGAVVGGANPANIDCDLTIQTGGSFTVAGQLNLGGSWINNGGTLNTTGIVNFTGAAKQIGGTTATDFDELIIGDTAGDSVTALYDISLSGVMTVTADAAFTLTANRNLTSTDDVTINGTMNLSGTSTWELSDTKNVQVNSGGLLSVQGTDSANRVTITRSLGTGFYHLLIDGGIDFNFANVYYAASADKANTGFQIRSPGGETLIFDNVAINFTEEVNGSVMLTYDTARTVNATGITFDSSTYAPGNDFNVEARSGTINFINYGGNYAGEADDFDNGGAANWSISATLVKRAFLSADGSAIADTASLPKGTLVKFLIYLNNTGPARSDISVRDVLDSAFLYQGVAATGTSSLKVNNATAACALADCTAGEETTIFNDVNATAVKTEGVDADEVSIAGTTIDAGDQFVGNATVNVSANTVWALLFEVKMQ